MGRRAYEMVCSGPVEGTESGPSGLAPHGEPMALLGRLGKSPMCEPLVLQVYCNGEILGEMCGSPRSRSARQ